MKTMKIGSCAIQGCEPRQVRKEAAVSSYLDVPQERLIRAFTHCTVRSCMSTAGARLLHNIDCQIHVFFASV